MTGGVLSAPVVGVITWMLAAVAGAVSHELAHYVVWLVTGRDPKLHLRALFVEPRAGPATGTTGDRVAAAAPYICGVSTIVFAVVTASAVWGVFGVAMIARPSRADLAAIRGDVSWVSLE